MALKHDRHYYDRHYCALITPFEKDSLQIDYDAFREHVRYFTNDPSFIKLRGSFIANPEAAEMFYMTTEEREKLIRIVMEERRENMPIFAGVFGVRVSDAIECALHAKSLGVDGLFIFPPAGTMEVSTAMDGAGYPEIWVDWVKAIDDAAQLPIILHPAHPMTMEWGQSLPIESVEALTREIPNIVGYKMIYGNDAAHFRIARFLRTLPNHVGILNGTHLCWHAALVCDLVDGSVQGAWNWDKEAMCEHFLAWDAGDLEKVKKVYSKQIMPLWEYIYAGGTRIHVRYKLAVWMRGLISHPFMRQPMPPPRKEEAETIYKILEKTGLSIIEKKEFNRVLSRQGEILGKFY